MPDQQEDRPDVEAIIAEIRRDIRDAEFPDADRAEEHADTEPSLYHNLGVVNATWDVGRRKRTGLAGRIRRILDRVFGAPIDEIHTFNSHVTRVLNRIVKILDGTAAPENQAGSEPDPNRLAQLAVRLDKLEKRIGTLEGDA